MGLFSIFLSEAPRWTASGVFYLRLQLHDAVHRTHRSERRLYLFIATSFAEVLRRPVEPAHYAEAPSYPIRFRG
jgi:hypothetical protein